MSRIHVHRYSGLLVYIPEYILKHFQIFQILEYKFRAESRNSVQIFGHSRVSNDFGTSTSRDCNFAAIRTFFDRLNALERSGRALFDSSDGSCPAAIKILKSSSSNATS